MNAREAHDRAVQKLADEYRRMGFQVQREANLPFVFPDGSSYCADLLAERGDEHVVVEVKLRGVRGDRRDRQWDRLAKQIRARQGWHFKIVPVDREPSPLTSAAPIEAALVDAETLSKSSQPVASLLVAASAFEASARLRLRTAGIPADDDGPIVLIERLVSEGFVEQEEFVPLREALERRNAIAHGHLDEPPDAVTLQALIAAARRLLAQP